MTPINMDGTEITGQCEKRGHLAPPTEWYHCSRCHKECLVAEFPNANQETGVVGICQECVDYMKLRHSSKDGEKRVDRPPTKKQKTN